MADFATTVAPGRSGARPSSPCWLGPADRPLLGWLTTPDAGASTAGVLVLPDIGARYWSAHATLRALAGRLAGAGHIVLRLDYDGTGDSAGDQWDAGRLAAWRASAAAGAEHLRSLGCERLAVVGVRLGAMLALLDGASLGAEQVVAWAPESSGRRLVRGLRLLGDELPGEAGVTSGGVVFSAETLSDLGRLDLTRLGVPPAERVLVVGDVGPRVAARLRELGTDPEVADGDGSEVALDRAPEDAEVAEPVVAAVAGWLGPAPPAPASGTPPAGAPPTAPAGGQVTAGAPAPAGGQSPATAVIPWDGRRLTEEVVTIAGLTGVLTEPERRREGACTMVFLNAGSSSHVGPGRIWVEYARALAAAGHRALRVDWRGWGETPGDGAAPGRPYDHHAYAETVDLVRALRDDGHDRVVLSGLCASAWMALRVAREAPVDGAVAINPQLYWRWGDPVLSQPETEAWHLPALRRMQRVERLGAWSALDALGRRGPAGRWLDALAARRVRVLLLFSERDHGLAFLRTRLARRLARLERDGFVRAEEIPGIDHGMLRAWLRPEMVRAMLAHLDRIA